MTDPIQEAPTPGRAVIFDLDGTLADTLDDIANAVNHCLESMGEVSRPKGEYPLLIGDGLPMLCRRVLASSSATPSEAPDPERVETLRQKVMKYYDQHLVVKTRLFPGIDELVARLRAAGTPMAVLSNKPDFISYA